ncbi:hypothetical protein ACWDBW_15815 [Streptomyces sp. NPDC001107]
MLAFVGFISVACVLGARLANDVEQFFGAWIGTFQRLRNRLHHREDEELPGGEDEEEGSS